MTKEFVSCYFNIRKEVFSVSRKGCPVEHFSWVLLRDCRFHVNLNGRKRVLREKQKNVHSYVKGNLIAGQKVGQKSSLNLPDYSNSPRIRYNPYIFPYFFMADTEEPIYQCEECLLTNKQVFKIK